ncbi:MAG: hypothetical protein ABL955_06565 [Elusimicrobiota bacterium]
MKNTLARANIFIVILGFSVALSGCFGNFKDPLIGHAQATLKGCELGTPPDLRDDLLKARNYLKANAAALAELNSAKFYETSKAESLKALGVEYKGDARKVEAAYAYMSSLPFSNQQLYSLTDEITRRLELMAKVRESTRYVARIKEQEKRVNDIAFDKRMAELNRRFQQASVNNYNRTEGPDYIRHIRSDNTFGGSYTETTVKGHLREQVEASSKIYAAQERNFSASLARQESEFSKGNVDFAEAKAYMSNESDMITLKAWPELKAVLADLDRLREAM